MGLSFRGAPRSLRERVYDRSSEFELRRIEHPPLKYRRLLRPVASRIPVDVIPLRMRENTGVFMREIKQGDVL